MIVSVFGASSRLGHVFIEQADAAGLSMRLHYRAKPSEKVPASATVVVGSLSDPAAVLACAAAVLATRTGNRL